MIIYRLWLLFVMSLFLTTGCASIKFNDEATRQIGKQALNDELNRESLVPRVGVMGMKNRISLSKEIPSVNYPLTTVTSQCHSQLECGNSGCIVFNICR